MDGDTPDGKEITLFELMGNANSVLPKGSQTRWNYVEIMRAVVILAGQL